VAIGLVVVNAPAEPDDVVDVQVTLQPALDLLA